MDNFSTSTMDPDSSQGSEVLTPDTCFDLNCVFCKAELKDREPKLLPCLHSACNSCLIPDSGEPKKVLICPICKQELDRNEVLDNLFLLEHFAKNADGNVPEECKTHICRNCEENANASAFCSDCEEWLCEECVAAHLIVRVTKYHVIRRKDDMEGEKTPVPSQVYLFCPVHSREKLKLYCETCEKLTCRDCQLSEHKGHKFEFISEVCKDMKQKVCSAVARLEGKKKQIEQSRNLFDQREAEISQREKALEDEVKIFSLKAMTEFNRRGRELLQQVTTVCTINKTQLSLKKEILMTVDQCIDKCMKFSKSVLAHGSETFLVSNKRLLSNQLQRCLRFHPVASDLQNPSTIQFDYDKIFLTKINEMGSIIVGNQLVGEGAVPGQAKNRYPVMQKSSQNLNNQPVKQAGRGHTPVRIQPAATNQRLIPVVCIDDDPAQRQQIPLYGQPQVLFSTLPAQNPTYQLRHVSPSGGIAAVHSANVTLTSRHVQQVPSNTTVSQQQQKNFEPPPLPLLIASNSDITISAVPPAPKKRPQNKYRAIPFNFGTVCLMYTALVPRASLN